MEKQMPPQKYQFNLIGVIKKKLYVYIEKRRMT